MLSIRTPKAYVQEPGLRARAGDYIKPHAQVVRILTSPHAWQAVNPALVHSLERAGIRWERDDLGGECTAAAVARLQQNVKEQGAQAILAIGGGRVLDCAKTAADTLDNVAVITFSTLAATCAAWSPFAILYNDRGGHEKSLLLNNVPALVLVDSEVIAHSDVRYLKAGIVDALAKWYEFDPYQRQTPDRLALDLKVSVAQDAVAVYTRWGDAAIAANRAKTVTPALEKVIEANIVLAGLANSVQDAMPTPGVAHVIHDRLTHQPELHDWLHGEKVGFSLLIQSLLERGENVEEGLLARLRQYESPLRLPALSGDRAGSIRRIAQEIHFPAASAANLPFAVTHEALARALLQTEKL